MCSYSHSSTHPRRCHISCTTPIRKRASWHCGQVDFERRTELNRGRGGAVGRSGSGKRAHAQSGVCLIGAHVSVRVGCSVRVAHYCFLPGVSQPPRFPKGASRPHLRPPPPQAAQTHRRPSQTCSTRLLPQRALSLCCVEPGIDRSRSRRLDQIRSDQRTFCGSVRVSVNTNLTKLHICALSSF